MTLPRITFWLVIVGGFIALPTSVIVYNKVRIALHADDYERAVFVVNEVGVAGSPNKITYRFARGKIGGRNERMSLEGHKIDSSTYQQLAREFPKGTEIRVWYDPTAPDVLTQHKTLRVIPGSVDLRSAVRVALITLLICLGPLASGLICLLICRLRGLSVFPKPK